MKDSGILSECAQIFPRLRNKTPTQTALITHSGDSLLAECQDETTAACMQNPPCKDFAAFPGARLYADVERSRCIDERNVRQSLREVSEKPFCLRIIFFRQQAYIVAKSKKLLILSPSFMPAASHRKILHIPE